MSSILRTVAHECGGAGMKEERQACSSPAHRLKGQTVWIILQNLQKVFLHVLEYEVKLSLPSKRLFEGHDVGVSQHAQHFDLAQRSLLDYFVILGDAV